MKSLFPLLFITLAMSATLHASGYYPYSPQDDDIEKAISATLFSKIDSNSDAKVSLDEIYIFRTEENRKRESARAEGIMTSCDTNKDGEIGGDELKEFSMDTFDPSTDGGDDDCRIPAEVIEMMDLDGNGSISKKEIIEGVSQRRRPPKKIRDKVEAKQKKRNDERMKKFQREQFERCDNDKDEYLTLREAASMNCNMYTEMFDARDKNSDSLISEEEMLADVKPPIPSGLDHSPNMRDFDPQLPPSVLLDMKMSTCDKNSNGKLELTETASKECEVDLSFFNLVDHNSDGAIDNSETSRMRMKQTFDEMDNDKDGYLDKKEFKGSRVRYM